MENKNSVTFVTFTDFNDALIWPWLVWWSARTHEEDGMQDRTPEWFRDNLIFAVFAVSKEDGVVAAAGLFLCLDENNELIYHPDGRIFAELGSLFVSEKYRKNKYSRYFVDKRKEFVRKKNHFPVMVTRNVPMTQKILNGSAEPIDNHENLKEAAAKIRFCGDCSVKKKHESEFCDYCPKVGKTILVFLDSIESPTTVFA